MEQQKLIPNSTQIPNILLDMVLPELPEGESRCLLYICRRIFGFHKECDRISFSQFLDGIRDKDDKILDLGAGISRPVLAESLKNLNEAGAIITIKDNRGNIYKINLDMDPEEVVRKVNQLRKIKEKKAKQTRLFKVVRKTNQLGSLTESGKEALPISVRLPNLQKKGKQRETKNYMPDFNIFWAEYPKKIAKKKAEQSWIKLKLDETIIKKIMNSLAQYKETEQWQKNDGMFVPYPATWLNQERWNDEITKGRAGDDPIIPAYAKGWAKEHGKNI